MTRVVVDTILRDKLHNLSEPLELCNEAGQVLARLIPMPDQSEYEAWEPPMSELELQHREQSDKWYTTEEVLAHLRDLESQ